VCSFFEKKKKVDKDTARHEDVRDYYEFGREIGRGGFSVVVEGAKKGTSERFAIKCIKKANVERDDIKLLRREIQIMKQVDHPNILKLFEVFESEEEFFLVMELVDGKVRLFSLFLCLCSIFFCRSCLTRLWSAGSTRKRTRPTLCARLSAPWNTCTSAALRIATW
jgi:serine/threonine protein kinase